MRFIFGLIGLIAVIVIALWAFGLITFGGTPGRIEAPHITANVATVSMGTENKTVTVPTLTVNKPAQPANTAAPQ